MSYDRRDSYESVSGSVETLVEKYLCLKDRGSRVLYWENVSSEKINEFDKLAKEATVVLCQDLVQVKMRNFSPF